MSKIHNSSLIESAGLCRFSYRSMNNGTVTKLAIKVITNGIIVKVSVKVILKSCVFLFLLLKMRGFQLILTLSTFNLVTP